MVDGVNAALQLLIEEIMASDTYKTYDMQRKKLQKYPLIKEQIDEYRWLNYELQQEGDVVLEQLEQFTEEYQEFRANPLVSDFLAAELALCRMVQDMNAKILETIHFE